MTSSDIQNWISAALDIPTPDERRFAAAKSALFLWLIFFFNLGMFKGWQNLF